MSAAPHGLTFAFEKADLTRWQVMIGAIVIQLILGTIYGYSIFWQPLEREVFPALMENAAVDGSFRDLVMQAETVGGAAAIERAHAARESSLKYAFGVCLLSFAGAMTFAGRLQDVKGPRYTASLGGMLLAAGFLIAGLSANLATYYVCHALLMGLIAMALLAAWHAVVGAVDPVRYPVVRYGPHAIVAAVVIAGVSLGDSYVSNSSTDRLLLLWSTIGLMAGAGVGFAYVCPIAALVKWFPRQKGMVAGIAVAGFGLGALIFSQKWMWGAVGFVEQFGITNFFLVHAVVCLLAVCGGAQLLVNPPASESGTAARGPLTKGGDEMRESTWRETIRTPAFMTVWVMFFSGALAGLMVIGILKPFAGQQLVEAASDATGEARTGLMLRGAEAVAWLAIFNAAGRIVWGAVSDRVGRTISMAGMFVLQACTMLALISLKSPVSLAVGAACVGFNFGGLFAVFPSITAELFGSRNLGANYGWVFTSYGVAGISGVALGNAARQATGSYFAAFAIAAGLCVVSAGLSVMLPRISGAGGRVEMTAAQ